MLYYHKDRMPYCWQAGKTPSHIDSMPESQKYRKLASQKDSMPYCQLYGKLALWHDGMRLGLTAKVGEFLSVCGFEGCAASGQKAVKP